MKKILFISLATILFLHNAVSAETTSDNNWTLEISSVDGVISSIDVFADEEGVLWFPFRFIAENIGAKVTWQAETNDIFLDFGSEQWELSDVDFDNELRVYRGNNTELLKFLFEEQFLEEKDVFSDISGIYCQFIEGISLPMMLVDDTNYINIYNLKEFAKYFRSELTVDDETSTVRFFIKPKPFYPGNYFEETKIKVDIEKNITEISALEHNGVIGAISFEDFMLAAGGKVVDYKDEYIENAVWKEEYRDDYYKTIEYRNNLLLCSINKSSYRFDRGENGLTLGSVGYTVRNVSKETDTSICYIKQNPGSAMSPGVRGLGYLFNGRIYMDVKHAKNFLKYCGYELSEEMEIVKVSDEFDESMHLKDGKDN